MRASQCTQTSCNHPMLLAVRITPRCFLAPTTAIVWPQKSNHLGRKITDQTRHRHPESETLYQPKNKSNKVRPGSSKSKRLPLKHQVAWSPLAGIHSKRQLRHLNSAMACTWWNATYSIDVAKRYKRKSWTSRLSLELRPRQLPRYHLSRSKRLSTSADYTVTHLQADRLTSKRCTHSTCRSKSPTQSRNSSVIAKITHHTTEAADTSLSTPLSTTCIHPWKSITNPPCKTWTCTKPHKTTSS